MNDMDIMVRTDKGAYSDFVHPLELGATGLMVPHCMSVEEARQIVAMTRFHPIGLRPLDAGNADGHYCMIPLADYMRQANDKTFLVVQIEDPEAVECVEEIAAIPGIDALFIGPGDLSQALGVPGNMKHPTVVKAIERVAEACREHGRAWGLPVSAESAPQYMEMGARFLASGADVLGLSVYFKQIRQNFEKLGFEFAPKI
ncbi:MAG: aldolase/citrate lyase family protein, partial [Bryobacteraceae bacterium]